MDDEDWINLQQLLGRGPQPGALPPETPQHILLTQALDAYGQGQRQTSGVTPQEWAEALQAYGDTRQPPQLPDEVYRVPALGAPDIQPTLLSDSISTPSPGASSTPSPGASGAAAPAADPSAGAALTPGSGSLSLGSSSPAAGDAGPSYAMASPADLGLPSQSVADLYAGAPPPPPAKPPSPAPVPQPAIQTTIDPIPGYDEIGDNAWRASNDKVFLDAVNNYNTANGYRPGDPGYWTADMLKAQAMVESGANRHAFETDPLQVNKNGDYTPDKKTILGLAKGQVMTPATSSAAALKWLQYKGWGKDKYSGTRQYGGDQAALWNYNGNSAPRSDATGNFWDSGLTQRDWYAGTIPKLAQQAEAARASPAGSQ